MLKRMAGLMLLVAALSTTPVFAGFEFHGYARAGVLLNADGGQAGKGATDQGTFDMNGPAVPFMHNIGRLGNENNNYLEAELTNTFKAGNANGAFKVRLASKDYEYTAYPVGDKTDNKVFVRELYSEIGGVPFSPKATFWAGKRFYGRDDIHINDYYWRIMDGTGAGVMNIPAGPGVVDVAWICHTSENEGDYPQIADKGQDVQQNLDIRYKGVKALGGEFELELTPSKSTGKVSNAKNAESGIQGAVVYSRADFFGLTGGSSKVGLQAGKGLGASLGGANGTFMNKDAEAMQLIAWGVANIGDKFKVSPSFVYSTISKREGANSAGGKDDADWMGITIRPQYNFTRNFALIAEFGYEVGEVYLPKSNDWRTPNGLESCSITKLTIAPTLTLDDTSFWTRPQLRAFVTYATFDKNLGAHTITGGDGNPYTGNGGMSDASMVGEDNGMTYGVQMEAWW